MFLLITIILHFELLFFNLYLSLIIILIAFLLKIFTLVDVKIGYILLIFFFFYFSSLNLAYLNFLSNKFVAIIIVI